MISKLVAVVLAREVNLVDIGIALIGSRIADQRFFKSSFSCFRPIFFCSVNEPVWWLFYPFPAHTYGNVGKELIVI